MVGLSVFTCILISVLRVSVVVEETRGRKPGSGPGRDMALLTIVILKTWLGICFYGIVITVGYSALMATNCSLLILCRLFRAAGEEGTDVCMHVCTGIKVCLRGYAIMSRGPCLRWRAWRWDELQLAYRAVPFWHTHFEPQNAHGVFPRGGGVSPSGACCHVTLT